MSTNVSMFEVRVEVKGDKPIRTHPWKDCEEEFKKIIKMLHIERRTSKQAINEGRKCGRVMSCRQLNKAEVIERESRYMESLPLENERYVNLNPYVSAVAMDEMIWKKKKRLRKNI